MNGRAIVLRGDAAHLPLPDASVDLIVTSPPYFGLRSYTDGGEHYGGQLGSEATPREYIAALLDCTREWARVLKPSGSLFVNLGDKYNSAVGGQQNGAALLATRGKPRAAAQERATGGRRPAPGGVPQKSLLGLPWRYALGCVDDLGLILRAEIVWAKPNGLPESVTDRVRRSHEQVFHFTRQPRYFAAVDEVREAHAPASLARFGGAPRKSRGDDGTRQVSAHGWAERSPEISGNPLGKLPGSVWEIPSQPLTVPAALGVNHFAAFPMELPRRIILGWSPSGICTACGEGRRPVAAGVALNMNRPQARRAQQLADQAGLTEAHLQALLSVGVSDTGRGAATQNGTGKNTAEVYALADEARAVLGGYAREYLLRRPTRFGYACACTPHARQDVPPVVLTDADTGEPFIAAPARTAYDFTGWTPPPTRPAIVLDPFGGTGTTALVAAVHGRTGVSVDRSADYCRLARWRVSDPAERARAMQVAKPPPVPDGQASLFGEAEVAG